MSERAPEVPAEQFASMEQEYGAARFGMWVFLATEILFIGVLLAVYTIMRILHTEGFAAASRHTDIVIGTINSAILITSSVTMALAVNGAKRNWSASALRWLLIATLVLGVIFLGLKGLEYYGDYEKHLVPAINFQFSPDYFDDAELFFFMYYVMTGFHALHLIIGLVLIGVLAWMADEGRFHSGYYTPVENIGLYWHFVDIVWIFLYPVIYLVSRS